MPEKLDPCQGISGRGLLANHVAPAVGAESDELSGIIFIEIIHWDNLADQFLLVYVHPGLYAPPGMLFGAYAPLDFCAPPGFWSSTSASRVHVVQVTRGATILQPLFLTFKSMKFSTQ